MYPEIIIKISLADSVSQVDSNSKSAISISDGYTSPITEEGILPPSINQFEVLESDAAFPPQVELNGSSVLVDDGAMPPDDLPEL